MLGISILFIILFFISGLAVGSFINAAEYRMARGVRIGRSGGEFERSACPECQEILQARDLVPVLSYIALRGRCRYCGKRISAQYPVVEILTAAVFGFAAYYYGIGIEAAYVAVFGAIFIFLFVFDLKHQLIPDQVTLPAIVLALAGGFFGMDPLGMLVGGLVGGGFFGLQYLISRGKWIGGGDIRLGLLMGLFLGWQKLLVALFLAYVVGASVGLVLIATKRMTSASKIAFGTFLSASAFVTYVYGDAIIDWYLSLLV